MPNATDDALIEYLERSLMALTAMTRTISEPEYLMRQRPRDLARLYGLMSDVVLCLLRASLPMTRHDAPD